MILTTKQKDRCRQLFRLGYKYNGDIFHKSEYGDIFSLTLLNEEDEEFNLRLQRIENKMSYTPSKTEIDADVNESVFEKQQHTFYKKINQLYAKKLGVYNDALLAEYESIIEDLGHVAWAYCIERGFEPNESRAKYTTRLYVRLLFDPLEIRCFIDPAKLNVEDWKCSVHLQRLINGRRSRDNYQLITTDYIKFKDTLSTMLQGIKKYQMEYPNIFK